MLDMAHTVAAPAHEEHVADLSRTMQEINLGQVNPSKEDRNRRPLYMLKNVVDVRFARHLLPKLRCHSFTNNCITVCGTSDLEQRPVRPTAPHWSAITIKVLIQLLPDHLHQLFHVDWVSVAMASQLMKLHIGTAGIQYTTLLQA